MGCDVGLKLPPTNCLLNIAITKFVIKNVFKQVPERTWDARWSVQLLGKERQDLGGHHDHDHDHDHGSDGYDCDYVMIIVTLIYDCYWRICSNC